MGELILWTSTTGLKNIKNDNKFFAYSEKTELNNLQIIIPISAVCTFEESNIKSEGIEFYCFEKELW
jgi:hypothetical protein